MNRSDSSKIAKNAGITGVAEIPLQLIAFLSGIIITRILGADIFGIFVAASAVTSLGRIIGTLGLQKGVLRFIGLYKTERSQVNGIIISSLLMAFVASSLLALILTLSSGLLEQHVFNISGIGGAIALLAWALPFTSVFLVLTSILQAYERITLMAMLRKVVQPLLGLSLLLLFFLFGMRLSALIWRMIIANLILALISFYYVRKTASLQPLTIKQNYKQTPALLRFGIPLFVAEIIHIFMLRSDVLMISAFLVAGQVGIYGVVVRLSGLLLVPLVSLDTIVFPMLANYFSQNDSKSIGRVYRLSSHWATIISFPLFITTWIYAADLLALFGSEFAAGTLVLRIIIIGICIRSLSGSVAGVLTIGGHSRIILVNSIIAAAINLTANYLLIPRFGIQGAAFSTAGITIFWSLLMVAQVWKIYRIQPWSMLTLRAFALAAAVGLIFSILPLPLPGLLRLLIGGSGITVFFFAGLLISKSVTPADKYILGRLMGKFGLSVPASWEDDRVL